METSKYYTPEIEEFYIGFEFELFYDEVWKNAITNIIDLSKIVSPSTVRSEGGLLQRIEDGKIKVKYLDKQDIEELGFKFKETNKITDWYEIEFSGNRLPGESSYSYWNITLTYNTFKVLTIEAVVSTGETETFFEGTVKNKSELKKLLKQLNIC